MEKQMKSGDMVSWDYEPKTPAYGTIVWIEGDEAHIDFKNPITREYEVTKKKLTEVIKIGSK